MQFCRNLESTLNSQIAKLTETEFNAQVKHQNYIDDCKTKAKIIDDLHKNLDISIEKIHNIITNTNKV